MSYLLDTNVVSELAKPRRNPGVVEWLAETRTDGHYLSVLTLGELLRGIAKLRHRGDHPQADKIERFVQTTEEQFSRYLLPITTEVVRGWARQPITRVVSVVDGLIAATASAHGLAVATRNVSDFEPTGVTVINPFSAG